MATAVVTGPLPTPSINISSPNQSHSSNSTPRNPVPVTSTMLPSASSHQSSNVVHSNNNNSSTSHSSASTVVPQYPYNVSMPPFAGALLPYERAPMPDDNDVQTRLPSICVDYLSHNWDEKDVWTSWKAMTRHKHEMANGVRLENASWRTWAKQRSNLKTISPETLNCIFETDMGIILPTSQCTLPYRLKDSDVTWLYGPLHTAVDPVPPAKMSSLEDRFNLDGQAPSANSLSGSALPSRSGSAVSVRSTKVPGKPILKHRSLSEILGVTAHPAGASGESGSDGGSDHDGTQDGSDSGHHKRPRVSIAHPASDSTLVNLRQHLPVGKGSPSTLTVGYDSSTSGDDDSESNHFVPGHALTVGQPVKRKTAFRNSGNNSSGSGTEDSAKPKKHISFSHRVEQCIAVDSEEERGLYASKALLRSKAGMRASPGIMEDDDDDDEEDDVLTFRSSASRHPGINVTANRYPSYSSHLPHTLDHPMMVGSSSMITPSPSLSEPHTIARMAPTTLKSSEVLPAPSPVVVYDRDPIWSGAQGSSGGPSYPMYTVTSSPAGSGLHDIPPTAEPLQNPATSVIDQSTPSYYSRTYGPVTSTGGTTYPIPTPARDDTPSTSSHYTSTVPTTKWTGTTDDDDDTEEFTAMGFDYFSGPDLGVGGDYDQPRLSSHPLAGPSQNGFDTGTPSEEPNSTGKSNTKGLVSSPGSNSQTRLGNHQGPILVPQLKSPSQKVSSASSSSSSLTSSPLSHPYGASSVSSTTPPHTDKSTNLPLPTSSSASSLPNLISGSNERPDRMARGRSSSRGSSASSFERSTTDHYRHSSNSPSSQSPPANVSPHGSLIGVVGAGGPSQPRLSRSSGSSSSLSRSGASGDNLSRGKSRLIDVTIGEEDEQEDLSSGKGKLVMNGSDDTKSPGANPSPVRAGSLRKKSTSPPMPCVISAPKPASAQLATGFEADQEDDKDLMGSVETPNGILSALMMKKNGSASSLGSLKWADETLVAQKNTRRLSGDEFGFGNYYEEQEEGERGVIGKAVETAKELVGAIWSVGTRSIFGNNLVNGTNNNSGTNSINNNQGNQDNQDG
ncbi:uncharacterized protein MELLADRAFT_59235 [Melampsora larici-populina 98AG31]|uniref:Nitrogen regulatory protein areA GATA-like domain-containing protein n=1 Tax=Melampsora larici-populina (strain 98AG31 / pathotype 3-4-7) TaxID=747676 RepID=F4R5J5_MELLP|nr:uncharacterized protein MELLADRAFT_59235 [Melampsora larici-populina 98AG31]EGG12251.1 hypothetical protein MELLADRAFT_59235 [Melampsora larici-populina 98AG31]